MSDVARRNALEAARLRARVSELEAQLEHALRRESLLERIVHAFTGDRWRAERHEERHGRHG